MRGLGYFSDTPLYMERVHDTCGCKIAGRLSKAIDKYAHLRIYLQQEFSAIIGYQQDKFKSQNHNLICFSKGSR